MGAFRTWAETASHETVNHENHREYVVHRPHLCRCSRRKQRRWIFNGVCRPGESGASGRFFERSKRAFQGRKEEEENKRKKNGLRRQGPRPRQRRLRRNPKRRR